MKDQIIRTFRESADLKVRFIRQNVDVLGQAIQIIVEAFKTGNKVLLFGNGGSAADAQHLAAEFVNRFQRERRPLPAIALTVDTSVLTSISNDYGFEDIFSKQLQALGQAGDVALGISTSGRSPNVLKALKWARENGLQTVAWAGAEKTDLDAYCDLILHIPSGVTARVQEGHITFGHVLCMLVEEILFGERKGLA